MVLVPLLLGLLAWGLGLAGIFQKHLRHRYFFSVLSFGCCCGSLFYCLEIIHHWVTIEDVSAILDCTGALRLCAAVLICGTLLLNFISFLRKV